MLVLVYEQGSVGGGECGGADTSWSMKLGLALLPAQCSSALNNESCCGVLKVKYLCGCSQQCLKAKLWALVTCRSQAQVRGNTWKAPLGAQGLSAAHLLAESCEL